MSNQSEKSTSLVVIDVRTRVTLLSEGCKRKVSGNEFPSCDKGLRLFRKSALLIRIRSIKITKRNNVLVAYNSVFTQVAGELLSCGNSTYL